MLFFEKKYVIYFQLLVFKPQSLNVTDMPAYAGENRTKADNITFYKKFFR